MAFRRSTSRGSSPPIGSTVYLCLDADIRTNRDVYEAAAALSEVLGLRGAEAIRYVRIPGGRNRPGRRVGHPGRPARRDDSAAGAGHRQPRTPARKPSGDDDQARVEERFLDFICDHYRLGQDDDGNGYAIPHQGPRIVRMLRTGRPSPEVEAPPAFRRADPAHQVLARRVVKDVLADVEGLCQEAPRASLHLRCARHRNGLVIDLGDADGALAVVSPKGWTVTTCPPDGFPLFRRSENLRALPRPEPGGDLDDQDRLPDRKDLRGDII